LGVLSNGLYVVETDLTTFYRLANLRGGTIEFQPDLQLLVKRRNRDRQIASPSRCRLTWLVTKILRWLKSRSGRRSM
jgi:hypothetical protein